MEYFSNNQSLNEIQKKYDSLIKDDSFIFVEDDGTLKMDIGGRGDSQRIFNSLVKTILSKVASMDKEIVKISLEQKLDLYKIKKKKKR